VQANAGAQRQLLQLQQVDTDLTRAEHRLRTLPQTAQVAQLRSQLQQLTDQHVTTQTAMADLRLQVARVEADVTAVRSRADRDRALLDSGNVAAAKHLTDLEHEMATLARRQSELEDAELELLQAMEDLERDERSLAEQIVMATDNLAAAVAAEAEASAEIASEREELHQRRTQLIADLPIDLVALYERIRGDGNAVAAGVLRGDRCEACQMELSKADASQLRSAAADEVLRCPECRGIVVRAELLAS